MPRSGESDASAGEAAKGDGTQLKWQSDAEPPPRIPRSDERHVGAAAPTAAMEADASAHAPSTLLIHSCTYDFFGRRVATCSSDGMLRVFNEAGQKTAEWRAHSGSIWRIVWAHPEFGQVLASCSFDRKVCIWEETADTEDPMPQPRQGGWRIAAELQHSRDSVLDVKFAPRGLGLWLASCGADKMVRLHEAPDVMDLNTWQMTYEFEAEGAHTGDRPCTPQCLAWNPSAHEGMSLVIGMADGSTHLWSLNEHLGGWTRVLALTSHGGPSHAALPHPDCIRDVCWAPDMGRSHHVIAIASRDRRVMIWEILRTQNDDGASLDGTADIKDARVQWSGECTCDLLHDSQVWRVEWNSCGSMLAAAVDDGHVHIYVRDGQGGWSSEQQAMV